MRESAVDSAATGRARGAVPPCISIPHGPSWHLVPSHRDRLTHFLTYADNNAGEPATGEKIQ